MICEGGCGKKLTRRPGENKHAFNLRRGCGEAQCNAEIRYRAKEKGRINNATWFRSEPSAIELFYLGRPINQRG